MVDTILNGKNCDLSLPIHPWKAEMGVPAKGLLLSIVDLFYVQNAEIFGFSQSPCRNHNIHWWYKTCSASKYSHPAEGCSTLFLGSENKMYSHRKSLGWFPVLGLSVDETTEGLFSLNIQLPSNQNSPRRDHSKTKINLIPLALCFVQNRRMYEAGFIKILQMAVSNLAVQKCFNNLATKKKI